MIDRETLLKEAHEDAMYRVQDMDGAVAFIVYRDAFIAALEAAGVRMVPVEATAEMKAALMAKSPLNEMRCKLAWDCMIAASPYAP